MLRTLLVESGHALRALRRERAFALVAALTLALGIGATTATFGVLRGVSGRVTVEDREVRAGSPAASRPARPPRTVPTSGC